MLEQEFFLLSIGQYLSWRDDTWAEFSTLAVRVRLGAAVPSLLLKRANLKLKPWQEGLFSC
jgi:hypothetical protein